MGGLRRGGGLIGPPRVRPPGSRDRSVGGEREFRQPQRGGTRPCGERVALARGPRGERVLQAGCCAVPCAGFEASVSIVSAWWRWIVDSPLRLDRVGSDSLRSSPTEVRAAPRRKRRPVCCGSLAGRRRYWNECLNRTFLRCFRRSNRALRRRRSKTIARAGWAISWPVGTAC